MTEEIIEFNKSDIFFMPVLWYFASWLTFSASHTNYSGQLIDGRLRGIIVPQLEFEDCDLIRKLRNQEAISGLRFTLNPSPPGDPTGRMIKSDWANEYWLQQLVGHSFEIARPTIKNKFGKTKKDRKRKWPEVLQFFYHLRNGCYHGNQFNIYQDEISTTIKTAWRGKEVGYADNGRKVVNDFICQADCVTLLHDVQRLIA